MTTPDDSPQDLPDPTHPGPRPRRLFSAPGRLIALLIPALLVYSGLVAAGLHFTEFPPWLILLVAAGASLPFTVWAVGTFLSPLMRTVEDLANGIRSFQDRDFSMRIASRRKDELGELVELYNHVGEILRDERSQIRQRELLLQAALDQSPLAIVLLNPLERVLYANHEARRLFLGGRRLGGFHFQEILASCPEEMRQVLESKEDGMFTVNNDEEIETYHLSQRSFAINRQPHSLLLLRRMTAELARQEAEIWKKVIRIISHELNNSLAPISSLAHSARTVVQESEHAERLEPIYLSIRERIDHLTGFLEGYARFARLPKPVKQDASWKSLIEGPRELYPFELTGEAPTEPGHFDPSQMEQVLINLLKNAREASQNGEPITVGIHRVPTGGFMLRVTDRGRGMDEDVLRQALLPFYSTKQTGSGVGLPLCREIVEAHGGALRIQSKPDQGTTVSVWLPAGTAR